MSDKLKPCPFCGSGDVSEHYSGAHVTCKGCTAEATPENWQNRHIAAADVPPEVRREIEAAALERLADEYDTVVSDSATTWQIRDAAERLRGAK